MNSRVMTTLAAAAVLGMGAPADTPPKQPDAAELRSAAARGLNLLHKVGAEWKQQCISCHNQIIPAMAARVAREHGVPVDEAIARKAARPYGYFSDLDMAVQATFMIDPTLSDGYGLVGAWASGVKPSLATAVYARRIANLQREDGSWTIFDGRPPSSSSLFTATAIGARALDLYLPDRMAEAKREHLARARRWLAANKPGTVEERAFQLLGLKWTGASWQQRAAAAQALLALQREDGGWAQIPSFKADPYATGQAIYALREAGGVPRGHEAVTRGVRWLMTNQREDGSWLTPTRLHTPVPISPPYFESGYPHGKDQFISAAGASWAVMALAMALPEANDSPGVPRLEFAEPASVAPWMETALFGTADELRAMLDGGLDPNSRSANGTTILMMAAPDMAKMQLLANRGADLKAKAASGQTALMIAAQYRGSSDAVQFLLSKGAAADPGAGVMFNASPLFNAVYADDLASVKALIAAGAPVNRKMMLVGSFPISPMGLAVAFEHTAMMRVLAQAGANVNEISPDGLSLLGEAAVSNKVEAARTLIELGADRSHRDKWGYTPARHARETSDFPSGVASLFE